MLDKFFKASCRFLQEVSFFGEVEHSYDICVHNDMFVKGKLFVC